jgi:UDP-perosamine 4-acetyltransferase
MALPIIVLGGGDHAKVVIDTLLAMGRQILGYSDPEAGGGPVLGISRLGGDENVFQLSAAGVLLANGVGSAGPTPLRRVVYEKFKARGYVFERIVHPSAVVATQVQLDDGVQIMAGAVIQPGAFIGANSIVNTAASVDHDCSIGSHVHIAPGAVLCGDVRVAPDVHIGAGATIIQAITIGAGSIIGAGAVVVKDVPPNVTVVGVPARVIKRGRGGDQKPGMSLDHA